MINPKSKPHFTLEVNGVNVPVWVWDAGPNSTMDRITLVTQGSVFGLSDTGYGFNQYLGEYGPKYRGGDGYVYHRGWGKRIPASRLEIAPDLMAAILERIKQIQS